MPLNVIIERAYRTSVNTLGHAAWFVRAPQVPSVAEGANEGEEEGSLENAQAPADLESMASGSRPGSRRITDESGSSLTGAPSLPPLVT